VPRNCDPPPIPAQAYLHGSGEKSAEMFGRRSRHDDGAVD